MCCPKIERFILRDEDANLFRNPILKMTEPRCKSSITPPRPTATATFDQYLTSLYPFKEDETLPEEIAVSMRESSGVSWGPIRAGSKIAYFKVDLQARKSLTMAEICPLTQIDTCQIVVSERPKSVGQTEGVERKEILESAEGVVGQEEGVEQKGGVEAFREETPKAEEVSEEEWEYYDESEDEKGVKMSGKTANLDSFGIPASLLMRWDYTIWDSDEESEEEDEEDEDEFSPYNKDQVSGDKSCYRKTTIKDWFAKMEGRESKDFGDLNEIFHEENRLCQEEEEEEGKRKKKTGNGKKMKEGVVKNGAKDEQYKTELFYCQGKKHGYARVFRQTGRKEELDMVTLYNKDCETGPRWQRHSGDAFTFSYVDENNNSHEATYLYPDLVHCLKSEYKDGKLVKGHFGVVVDVVFDQGIPVPKVKILDKATEYCQDISSSFCISRFPHLRDPMEHRRVFVDHSGIPYAGEGLFAKERIEEGSLIALFNGIRLRESFLSRTAKESTFSSYKIGLNRDFCLDITEKLSSLDNYSATLGHKACHSFTPNAEFRDLFHPRFGHIMSIVAKGAITIDNQKTIIGF